MNKIEQSLVHIERSMIYVSTAPTISQKNDLVFMIVEVFWLYQG